MIGVKITALLYVVVFIYSTIIKKIIRKNYHDPDTAFNDIKNNNKGLFISYIILFILEAFETIGITYSIIYIWFFA